MKRWIVILLMMAAPRLCFAEDRSPGTTAAKPDLEAIRKRAEGGDAYSQAVLSEICRRGEYGTKMDDIESLKWAQKSAAQKHPMGMYSLAYFLTTGKGGAVKDASRAESLNRECLPGLTDLAKRGDARAQYDLGCLLADGSGTEKDEKQAFVWHAQAAEQGHANAQFSVGSMYREGWGVKPDHGQALKWYMKAAEQQDAHAQCHIGFMYMHGLGVTEDQVEGAKWYLKAAEQGDACAEYDMGHVYEYGFGVKQDYKEAYKWYIKAAKHGWLDAMGGLGRLYLYGNGVEKNVDEAIRWAERFARYGDIGSCILVADAYRQKGNKQEALKWCKTAIDLGDDYACGMMGTWYRLGYVVEKDSIQSALWYSKAIRRGEKTCFPWLRDTLAKEEGVPEAQYQVGALYFDGITNNVPKDHVEAFYWLKKAAASGHQGAQAQLELIKQWNLATPGEEDKADARLKQEAASPSKAPQEHSGP